MDLRRHITESTVTMSKTAEGKVKVENKEVPSGDFIWDFYLTPAEARKFGQELVRLADELDPA
jgi:hypothetical protein